MKRIVHICLTSPYKEGMGYDENIMPYYHEKMGYKAYIISCFDNDHMDEGELNSFTVIRLNQGNRFGRLSQFGDYPKLFSQLCRISPDIIYVHNAQFIGFIDVIKYKKINKKVRVYVDNHDDYYNSPINNWRLFVLNYIVFRIMLRYSSKYVETFWGVTPWRCQYLREVFGIPKNKIHLLVMGGDDRYINLFERERIRNDVRKAYGFADDDFLILTGGKIDRTKGIHILLKALLQLKNTKVKLLIFGKMDPDMERLILPYCDNKKIVFVGWKSPSEYYNYMLAADIGCFPGTHSILWEQSCACGLPIIVKDWKSMHHVDVGGNAFFLKRCSTEGICDKINAIMHDNQKFEKAKKVARIKATNYFSYRRISYKAIGEQKRD